MYNCRLHLVRTLGLLFTKCDISISLLSIRYSCLNLSAAVIVSYTDTLISLYFYIVRIHTYHCYNIFEKTCFYLKKWQKCPKPNSYTVNLW